MGKLVAGDYAEYFAGIGGGDGGGGGYIYIHGGNISAEGCNGAAGIGGGHNKGANIRIYGGEIYAEGGKGAAGIGGGAGGGKSNVLIRGGNIKATSKGTGIGAPCDSKAAEVSIYGGTITAKGEEGPGISGYSITISGGTITAKGGKNSAAIGFGPDLTDCEIKIKGGNVRAIADSGGYGIGATKGKKATIKLSWTNLGDRIYASSYSGTVNVQKEFIIEGTSTIVQGNKYDKKKINNKTLLAKTLITVSATNGTVTPDNSNPASGTTVKLTVVPNPGYMIESVSYNDGTEHKIKPSNGTYQFKMPKGDVTVKATFKDLTISTANDWELFRTNVNNGRTFEGETVTLSDDITVDSHVCNNNSHRFKGTFDGQGHTITFNESASSQPGGLFRYVENATFKNLKVAGTFTNGAGNKYTGGICGWTYGTVNIIGCVSEQVISCAVGGESYHGGFVAINQEDATLNITNCVFAGKLLGSSDKGNGGFVGYNESTISLSNCLFMPAEVTMSGTGSRTFNRGNKAANYNTCYYTQPFGTSQGNKVVGSTEKPSTIGKLLGNDYFVEVYENGMKYGDKYYVKSGLNAYSYLDASGQEQLCTAATDVTGSTKTLGADNSETWYAVGSDITISSRITVRGTVNLILANSGRLEAQKGITVSNGNTLNIFGQADDTGQLIANGDNSAAGIGSGGNINIYGGIITAQGISGGTVTLSYNSANSSITSDSYSGTVNVASGKKFRNNADATEIFSGNSVAIGDGKTIVPVTYTIRFDKNANDAEGTMADLTMVYSKAGYLTANAFTRKGYTFSGWNTQADGNGTNYADIAEVTTDLASTQGAVVTLYAKWTAVSYTIHYDANGGTGEMADQTFDCDETPVKTISANAFSRTGYTFEGWNTVSNTVGGKSCNSGDLVTTLATDNGNEITLYAQWKFDYANAWGTDGTTEESAYVISNKAALDRFANELNAGGKFKGKFVKLDADIDLTGQGFAGLPGTFEGTFDGDGHTISGLDITAPSVGFFAILNGTVKNLTLKGKMTVEGYNGSGGAVAADTESEAVIDNCVCLVTMSSPGYQQNVGGVVGYNDGGIITNCYYLGTTADYDHINAVGYIFAGDENDNHALFSLTKDGDVTMSGLTIDEGTIIDNKYIAQGQTLTMTLTADDNAGFKYQVMNDLTNSYDDVFLEALGNDEYSLMMPAQDVYLMPVYLYDGLSSLTYEENAYHVKTVADLKAVADAADAGYADYTFVLDNDITITIDDADKFSGIASFSGTFDGQGHTISGMNISGADEAGFIGNLSGTVKNLTLKDCTVTGTNYVGILAGSIYNGNIYDCFVDGGTVIGPQPGAIAGNFSATYASDNYYTENVVVKTDENVLKAAGTCGTGSNGDCYYEGVAKAALMVQVKDNANNDATIKEFASGTYRTVQLQGRTFYKDGNWNTLCLPFNVSTLELDEPDNPLYGATVMMLDNESSGFNAGTLTLNFNTANWINAGKPYIVKWDKDENYDENPSDYDITNPVFKFVKIPSDYTDAEAIATALANAASQSNDGTVTFKGSYASQSFNEDNKSILFLGGNNTLYWPKSGATIGACRAYFELNGITVGDPSFSVRSIVFNFDDSEATSIDHSQFIIDNSSLTIDNEAGAWYTLDGRKLNKKPTKSGLYIRNGRKIVIK
jgi:uncharacterized repeat protein (TIGR02543 family)